MKSNIHPAYHHNTQVTCACGNTFTTGSILPEIRVEICSACHPFFTGEQRLVDTEGQIDKFQRKRQLAQKAALAAAQKAKKGPAQAKKEDQTPKTLREMLEAGS